MVDAKINENALQDIFKQEINPVIWHSLTLAKSNYVNVLFKFDLAGKVIDIGFITQSYSPISPIILEKIENRIKREITASYNRSIVKSIGAPAYTTFNFIEYSMTLYFNKM